MWLLPIACLLNILLLLQLASTQDIDTVASGNYRIRNCDGGKTGSKAEYLQNLLPQIYTNLQVVLADAKLGNLSTHGYETFFHSNDNIPYVSRIYQNIAAGAPVPLSNPEGRALNPLLNIGLPTLVCVEGDTPDLRNMRNFCESNPEVPAAHLDQFIALCPTFWETESEAQTDQCPRLRKNTLTPNDYELAHNQQACLVHELAHVYGVQSDGRWQDGIFETYNIRDAANLDERSALKNAQNYAFYYSANQANCKRWPNRNLPHDNLRGLLEVLTNSSSIADSIATAVNVTQPLDFDNSTAATLGPSFDVSIGFCNGAVAAPNSSTCCVWSTGYWAEGKVVGNGAQGNLSCADGS